MSNRGRPWILETGLGYLEGGLTRISPRCLAPLLQELVPGLPRYGVIGQKTSPVREHFDTWLPAQHRAGGFFMWLLNHFYLMGLPPHLVCCKADSFGC